MTKDIKISLCKPNKQFKSWHILKFIEPNGWYPIAFIKEPKNKDKDFLKVMEYLYEVRFNK